MAHADGRGAADPAVAVRRRVRDGRQPRTDRRGAARRPGQPKDGNYLYGAFGHDFETRDGRRVMVVALTARQWRALVKVTEIGEACAKIARSWAMTWTPRPAALRARPDRRAAASLVRLPRTSPGPRGVHRHRRLLGLVSDVSPARHTRIHVARPPTRCSRRSSNPGSASTWSPDRRWTSPRRDACRRARAGARRAHRRGAGRTAGAQRHRDRPAARRRRRRRPGDLNVAITPAHVRTRSSRWPSPRDRAKPSV